MNLNTAKSTQRKSWSLSVCSLKLNCPNHGKFYVVSASISFKYRFPILCGYQNICHYLKQAQFIDSTEH